MRNVMLWAIALCTVATSGGLAHSRNGGSRLEPHFMATAQGVEARGIRVLSGADGFITFASQGGARCLTTQEGPQPPSIFLYFDVDASREQINAPLYVVVDYFDDAAGGVLTLEYDSDTGETLQAKYRRAEGQAGGRMLGTRSWRKAIFEIQQPLFANRQNLGADFRLHAYSTRIYVRSVRVVAARPEDWEETMRREERDLRNVRIEPLVKIGRGGQLTIGGFDPARKEDAAPMTRALEAVLPALKQLGVTSHEGYVRWNLCEPEPGKYDWSVYDRYVEIYKRYGIKWVPFLIVGPAYSLPHWYYRNRQAGYQGYVCLEHGEESDVQSLWNPALREHVARFIRAFCEHYRDSGVIESILLSITGNYGEAV